jgi:membrane protein YqaA with SNARE-associated domain
LTYLLVAAVVFGVNLLPAFGPPTWSILVFFRLRSDLNPVALVLIGALAAGCGRYLLAEACRHLRGHLSERRTANLAAAKGALTSSRFGSLAGLALFAISPIPSAQLFEAAGLMDVSLLPLIAMFFTGRLVSYSLYVAGASAVKDTNLGKMFAASLTSPVGIAVQVAMLGAVVALTHIDWAKVVAHRRHEA